jgi:hypothetical protein
MEYPVQEITQKQQSINTFAAAHRIHFNPLSTLSATASNLSRCKQRLICSPQERESRTYLKYLGEEDRAINIR